MDLFSSFPVPSKHHPKAILVSSFLDFETAQYLFMTPILAAAVNTVVLMRRN